MVLQTVLNSNEIEITEDWAIIKLIGTKEQFEGVNVGDVIEYVPSWSEYKLSNLDMQMYEKGFKYKKMIVIKSNETTSLTEVLVPITIDTATLISQGKMRSDCGDIRFYWWNNIDKTWDELGYKIDNTTVNTSSTSIILRVPYFDIGSYAVIAMYFGAMHYGRYDDVTVDTNNVVSLSLNIMVFDEINISDINMVWRGKVVKKIESGNSVVLYICMNNLGRLLGEVV